MKSRGSHSDSLPLVDRYSEASLAFASVLPVQVRGEDPFPWKALHFPQGFRLME